jgi:hypothetical protein
MIAMTHDDADPLDRLTTQASTEYGIFTWINAKFVNVDDELPIMRRSISYNVTMEADQSASKALIQAGQLVGRYGFEALGEASLRSLECKMAGECDAALFWLRVRAEALDLLIARTSIMWADP